MADRLGNAVSGIYAIRRISDGATYIGQSINCRVRFNHHRHHLRLGSHRNPRLQHAWNKHGEGSFEFVVLEECDWSELTAREQANLDSAMASGATVFNASPVAECPNRGRKMQPLSEEHRAKIAASVRGLVRTAEHRANLGAAHRGRKLSQEHKDKLRAAKAGKKQSPEHVAKRAAASTGKKRRMSDAARARVAEANRIRGASLTEQQRQALSAAALGRRHTDETKARCREAALRYWSEMKGRLNG